MSFRLSTLVHTSNRSPARRRQTEKKESPPCLMCQYKISPWATNFVGGKSSFCIRFEKPFIEFMSDILMVKGYKQPHKDISMSENQILLQRGMVNLTVNKHPGYTYIMFWVMRYFSAIFVPLHKQTQQNLTLRLSVSINANSIITKCYFINKHVLLNGF